MWTKISVHPYGTLEPLTEASFWFSRRKLYYGARLSALKLEDKGIPFVWIITCELSGMGDPTRSYNTVGVALWIL